MKTVKIKLRLLSLMMLTLMGSDLLAQPCKTDNLVINTGYDPVTQATLAVGASDPSWNVTSYSPALLNTSNTSNLPAGVLVPGPAKVADGVGGTSDPNSRWVSFYDPAGSSWSNWYETLNAGDYYFVMKRTFTVVCGQTDLDVDIKLSRDNYVLNVKILDPSSTVISNSFIDPVITVNTPSYYNNFYQIPPFTLSNLAPGTYTIEVDVHNLHVAGSPNPHGVNIVGSLTSPSGNLLAPGHADCDCECEDKCYWKVQGNTILNGNNIFGTLTDDDIRIKSANNDRGIIEGGNATQGGYMGWNTMSPTARFHVNCIDGNEEGGLSDIRFENLEQGTGKVLAIDANGYVFNSGIDVGGGGTDVGEHWDLSGNTITSGNNFLGTNSPHDVIMRTSGIDKGIWTSGMSGDPHDDGRLGWQTLNPTAHLHINCIGGNPDDGGAGSDVRFEELEGGFGNILVIDDQGYVYNSRVKLNPDGGIGDDGSGKADGQQQARINQMEHEITELKAQVAALLQGLKTGTITPDAETNMLYQNIPNPFGTETVIPYYIKDMQQNAFVVIYDMNGRELSKHTITEKGKGNVRLNAEKMLPGHYTYSLIVDGERIDSKTMVLSK